MAVVLDDEDKAGTAALLVRLLRIQDQRNHWKEKRDEAAQRYTELDAQWEHARQAFRIFGFDPKDAKELWNTIKGAIGQDGWDSAFERARGKPTGPVVDKASAGAQADEGNSSNQTGAEDGATTVREIVLAELRNAGTAGKKAGELREIIARGLGREIHEKTTGMTLYRLSQEKLVRRNGRTWFIVPPKAETVNPGAATPGSATEGQKER